MKLAASLVTALLLAACAQTPPASPPPAAAAPVPAGPASSFVELTNPANGTRIALKAGGELKLLLDADPKNAMHWVSEDVSPVLSPIGERVLVSKSMNVADNTAGAWNIFRYRAEKRGNVTLQLEARRFDVAGPALRTVRYEVTVE